MQTHEKQRQEDQELKDIIQCIVIWEASHGKLR